MRRLIFFRETVRSNAPDTLNQFSLNFFFHKLRLCESNLKSTRNDLVVFSQFSRQASKTYS